MTRYAHNKNYNVGDWVVLTKACKYCNGDKAGAVCRVREVSRNHYILKIDAQYVPSDGWASRTVVASRSWGACDRCLRPALIDELYTNEMVVYGKQRIRR
jgi:hypothetical protein